MRAILLLLALLLFTSMAHAQFTDDFNRADEALEATSWTKATAAGGTLAVDNNTGRIVIVVALFLQGRSESIRLAVREEQGTA